MSPKFSGTFREGSVLCSPDASFPRVSQPVQHPHDFMLPRCRPALWKRQRVNPCVRACSHLWSHSSHQPALCPPSPARHYALPGNQLQTPAWLLPLPWPPDHRVVSSQRRLLPQGAPWLSSHVPLHPGSHLLKTKALNQQVLPSPPSQLLLVAGPTPLAL